MEPVVSFVIGMAREAMMARKIDNVLPRQEQSNTVTIPIGVWLRVSSKMLLAASPTPSAAHVRAQGWRSTTAAPSPAIRVLAACFVLREAVQQAMSAARVRDSRLFLAPPMRAPATQARANAKLAMIKPASPIPLAGTAGRGCSRVS